MTQKKQRLLIIMRDTGYELIGNDGGAAYSLEGYATSKLGGVDKLPDELIISDLRLPPQPVSASAETEMSEQNVKQIRELVNKTTKEAIRNEQRPGGTLWAMQRDGDSALKNCNFRFGDSKPLPYPLGGFPHPKRKIALTVSGLDEWKNGILKGTKVTVSVYQGDKLLRSEVIAGKASSPYTQTFEVNSSFGELMVIHNRPDLPLLKVSAEFVK